MQIGLNTNKMVELRKDYLLERYVLIAAERSKRPDEFKQEKVSNSNKKMLCVFCPGNEGMTPNEVYRLGSHNHWEIRVIPNKYKAVGIGNPNLQTHNDFFTFADGVGEHELLIETPYHSKQLADMNVDRMADVFRTYAFRIKELCRIDGVKYVAVFKNHGSEGGTSIVHSHSQIIAYNLVPVAIQRKEDAVKKFMELKGACPYCRILNIEKTSYRSVHENETFVCFTPYASRYAFEVWFFPKRHVTSVTDLTEKELLDLCGMLKKVLLRLKALNASYNFYLQEGVDKMHFHIELCPRLAKWAGFELCTETIINTMPPEDAARFYRGEK